MLFIITVLLLLCRLPRVHHTPSHHSLMILHSLLALLSSLLLHLLLSPSTFATSPSHRNGGGLRGRASPGSSSSDRPVRKDVSCEQRFETVEPWERGGEGLFAVPGSEGLSMRGHSAPNLMWATCCNFYARFIQRFIRLQRGQSFKTKDAVTGKNGGAAILPTILLFNRHEMRASLAGFLPYYILTDRQRLR